MLEIRLNDSSTVTPTRANPDDAGLDLYVPANSKYVFHPGEKLLVNTRVQVAIPNGYVGLLTARSSLQKKGLMVANSVGIIDAGYRGDLMVALWNFSSLMQTLEPGEKFAQLVLVPIITPEVIVASKSDEEWANTSRGVGGFGSTGK